MILLPGTCRDVLSYRIPKCSGSIGAIPRKDNTYVWCIHGYDFLPISIDILQFFFCAANANIRGCSQALRGRIIDDGQDNTVSLGFLVVNPTVSSQRKSDFTP